VFFAYSSTTIIVNCICKIAGVVAAIVSEFDAITTNVLSNFYMVSLTRKIGLLNFFKQDENYPYRSMKR
jgi:hypothetical protein